MISNYMLKTPIPAVVLETFPIFSAVFLANQPPAAPFPELGNVAGRMGAPPTLGDQYVKHW